MVSISLLSSIFISFSVQGEGHRWPSCTSFGIRTRSCDERSAFSSSWSSSTMGDEAIVVRVDMHMHDFSGHLRTHTHPGDGLDGARGGGVDIALSTGFSLSRRKMK